MIPSSATCGCGSTTTGSTPTSGVSGTFGCSGSPACLTITNGIVTAATNVALSGINGSAGCSGLNVPCITVTNGVVTALSERTISAGTSGRTQSVTIFDSADLVTFPFNNSGFSSDSEFTFVTDFVPTNLRITTWQGSAGYSNLFLDVAYSTDNVTFVPAAVNLQLDGGSGATDTVRTKSSSVSISGSPALIYWRLGYLNNTGSNPSVILKMLTVNLWN